MSSGHFRNLHEWIGLLKNVENFYSWPIGCWEIHKTIFKLVFFLFTLLYYRLLFDTKESYLIFSYLISQPAIWHNLWCYNLLSDNEPILISRPVIWESSVPSYEKGRGDMVDWRWGGLIFLLLLSRITLLFYSIKTPCPTSPDFCWHMYTNIIEATIRCHINHCS